MLVVMEHGNVEGFLQLVFDVKALRRLDVLKVDAAIGGGDQLADLHDVFDFLARDADGDRIHTCKALEQDGLSFHDRKTCPRADVAKTQDRGAVGDDGDHVALRCVVIDGIGILFDCKARCGNARRIGAAQIVA